MANPVVHFEIQSNRSKELQEFYSGVFDWKIDASNPMEYGIVQTHAEGGRGIDGGIGGTNGGPNRVTSLHRGRRPPGLPRARWKARAGRPLCRQLPYPTW